MTEREMELILMTRGTLGAILPHEADTDPRFAGIYPLDSEAYTRATHGREMPADALCTLIRVFSVPQRVLENEALGWDIDRFWTVEVELVLDSFAELVRVMTDHSVPVGLVHRMEAIDSPAF